MTNKYQRILVKISGEAFSGEDAFGIEPKPLQKLGEELKSAISQGAQMAVVVGAGNLFRGAVISKNGVDKTTADYMGMVATVINGLALQSTMERLGISTRLQTALEMKQLAEPYIRRRAIRHLEKASGEMKTDDRVLYELMVAYTADGNLDQARAVLSRLEQLNPQFRDPMGIRQRLK